MAGARIGYAIGAPEIISVFDKVRNHFGIGKISQAGALAALGDQLYLHDVRAKVGAARARLCEVAQENGLQPLPSATNFVTMDCGRDASFARVVLAPVLEPKLPPLATHFSYNMAGPRRAARARCLRAHARRRASRPAHP